MNRPVKLLLVVLALAAVPASRLAASGYFVDPKHPGASDANPWHGGQPWKTLARVGTAKELKPGDTVYVKSIFRDLMTVKVYNDPAKPLALQWLPLEPYSGTSMEEFAATGCLGPHCPHTPGPRRQGSGRAPGT